LVSRLLRQRLEYTALKRAVRGQQSLFNEAAPVWWTVVGLGDYGSACIISS